METTANEEIIPFKRYYKSLDATERKEFKKKLAEHMSALHFRKALRDDNFSKQSILIIEHLTGQKFIWDFTFKKYYKSMSSTNRKEFLKNLEKHQSLSNFWKALRENKFSKQSIFIIETLTNEKFIWKSTEA